MHIVQAPRIGWKDIDRCCLSAGFACLPFSISDRAIVVRLIRGNCFAKPEGRCRARTTGIFPLGFRWQTIGPVILLSQFPNKLLAVFPGNHFHRQIRFAFELARIVARDRLSLFLRYEKSAHVESLRQCDGVLGFFILPADLVFGTTAPSNRTRHSGLPVPSYPDEPDDKTTRSMGAQRERREFRAVLVPTRPRRIPQES